MARRKPRSAMRLPMPSRTASCAKSRRSYASSARRFEAGRRKGIREADIEPRRGVRRPANADLRNRADVRCDGVLHRTGHVVQMARPQASDGADRLGALCGGDPDRARCRPALVAFGRSAVQAPGIAGSALAPAARRDCFGRRRAQAVAARRDGDDFVSDPDLRRAARRTAAWRARRRRARDRDRGRVPRRLDRDPPRHKRLSAGRFRRRRGRRLQRWLCARDPQARRRRFRADDARLDPGRGTRRSDADAAVDLAMAGVDPRLVGDGGLRRIRRRRTCAADRRSQIRPRAGPDAVHLHPAHLDDRLGIRRVRRLAACSDLRRRFAGGGLRRMACNSRKDGQAVEARLTGCGRRFSLRGRDAEEAMPDHAPPVEGVLETSLYAQSLGETAAFYRDLFGFKTLVDSPRLVAFDIAGRSVLLVFQAGATEGDTVDPRGTIPGHDGRGRLHFAFAIAMADLDVWRARLSERVITIVGEYRWPRGGTSLYCHDPDGEVVELATPGNWW